MVMANTWPDSLKKKKTMSKYLIQFKNIQDERGSLTVLENLKNIPFKIKRVYYLNNLKADHSRGFHAHKELRQLAICLLGSCRFVMDDGIQKEELILSKFNQGIIIDPMIWHEMHNFSHDCVLIVLADDFYNEKDYIRDYSHFIKAVQEKRQ